MTNKNKIFKEIAEERKRQNELWGEQNFQFKHCTPLEGAALEANLRFYHDNQLNAEGTMWYDILMEEVCEAFLEDDPERQREEMIQVAAVAVQIIEYLDRKIAEGGING